MFNATSERAPSSFRQRVFRSRAEDTLPLTIGHHRIYILPTRRGLAFLVSLLLMLIASVNYSLNLGYALCFLLTGLFAASLLSTYKNLAGITINTIKTDNAFCGETIRFNVGATNNSTLNRLGLEVKTTKTNAVVNVLSGQTAFATLSMPVQERGKHPVGRITVTSTYPLGLWRAWSYLHTDAYALAYPAPEKNAPPIPSALDTSNGEYCRKATQGDVAGVREYVPGDSLSTIAWKSVARGQGLYVKEHESENLGGDIHFDLNTTGLVDNESQLSRLSAWLIEAEFRQQPYSFNVSGTQLDTACGSEQQHRALKALALFGSVE